MTNNQSIYWDDIADLYQSETHISTTDFHFGPLLPGDAQLRALPPVAPGMRCLEIGCGAAQNSIYLASLGAACTAIDISSEQLRHARIHADEAGATIELIHCPMEEIAQRNLKPFDFIHSVFALCFSDHPDEVIRQSAALLKPGGHLLVSARHPLFAGEWLEVDGEGMGTFLPDYFAPPDEERELPGSGSIRSRAYPISTLAEWIVQAGLQLERFLEPQPIDAISNPQRLQRIPYYSEDWLTLYQRLKHTPIAAIYLASLP